MGRLSWVIQVDSKCNHMHSYKSEAEGDLTHRGEGDTRMEWRRFEDADLEDWIGAATSRGMPAATTSWRRRGTDSPESPWKGCSPNDTLILAQ